MYHFMRKIILILFIIPFQLASQESVIRFPDVEKMESSLQANNYSDDEIYVYLTSYYKTESEKLEIKNYDFGEYSICAFRQVFELDIEYSTNSCEEGKGGSVVLKIPFANKEDVIKLIEILYKVNRTEIKNIWNKELTEYQPEDKGAGCYYRIKVENNITVINLWCGC